MVSRPTTDQSGFPVPRVARGQSIGTGLQSKRLCLTFFRNGNGYFPMTRELEEKVEEFNDNFEGQAPNSQDSPGTPRHTIGGLGDQVPLIPVFLPQRTVIA